MGGGLPAMASFQSLMWRVITRLASKLPPTVRWLQQELRVTLRLGRRAKRGQSQSAGMNASPVGGGLPAMASFQRLMWCMNTRIASKLPPTVRWLQQDLRVTLRLGRRAKRGQSQSAGMNASPVGGGLPAMASFQSLMWRVNTRIASKLPPAAGPVYSAHHVRATAFSRPCGTSKQRSRLEQLRQALGYEWRLGREAGR
ncbi:hypothetical protein SAMN05216593_102235 [Pseudomonas asturiensis]|uniref:Uncharacterized protein n=1 Tax=Pseudomonas asturiensis TaxID=1190415 RepID=A0A1M7KMD3_9PSED|nr:hypothetical protein SAMN05216593_102235 [Pseudomonas asturiensis]